MTNLSERVQSLKDQLFGVGNPARPWGLPCGTCAAEVPNGAPGVVHFPAWATAGRSGPPVVRWAACDGCIADGFVLPAVPGAPAQALRDPLAVAAKLLDVPVDAVLADVVLGRRANRYDDTDEGAPPLFGGFLLHGDRPGASPSARTPQSQRWALTMQPLRDAYALARLAADATETTFEPGCDLCRRNVQPAGRDWIRHDSGKVYCQTCSRETDIASEDPSFGDALSRLICDAAGLPCWASSGLAVAYGVAPSGAPAAREPFAFIDKDRLRSAFQAEQARANPGRPSVMRVTR